MPGPSRPNSTLLKNVEGYRQMMETTATQVSQMEQHLKELVKVQKMSESRIYEDEHRNVTAIQNVLLLGTTEVPVLQFIVPQGEAWTIERLSAQSSDTSTTAFAAFRDQVAPARLSLFGASVIAGGLANIYLAGSHILYLPERSQLFVVAYDSAAYSATAFDGNIQVRVRKRHQMKITSEEAFVLSGAFDEREAVHSNDLDYSFEPHDERHGDPDPVSGGGYGGDVAPPEPELPARPKPSWPQRVEHAVEEAVEYIEDKVL